jgi:cell division protein FtsB
MLSNATQSGPLVRALRAGDAARQRHKQWRRRIATGSVTLLAIFMGYHVVFGHNGLTAYQRKRETERDLQQQLQALDRENLRLREHVERLQSDPGAIEHQAREELHYTRSGEVIYTLPAERVDGQTATPAPTPAPSTKK